MKCPNERLGLESLETRLNLSAAAASQMLAAAGGAGAANVGQGQSAPRLISLNVGAATGNLWGAADAQAAPTAANLSPVRRNRPTRDLVNYPNVAPTPTPAPTFAPTQLDAPASPGAPAPLSFSPTDPLAPILAKLYGDDKHDDYPTIQKLVDTAYADNIKTITLPAGTFLLSHDIDFYGSGVTLKGQGDATILDVANNYMGIPGGAMGRAITAAPVFSPALDMISQAVTGNTIVFTGLVDLHAGDTVYLTNGRGSALLQEEQAGGTDTGPTAFKELDSDEYVTIASVTINAGGQTVATLTQNVLGAGDYFNVAPRGAAPSDAYLHVMQILKPADHDVIENLNIKFTNPEADASIYSTYTNDLTIQNIKILNASASGGLGSMWILGSENTVVQNVTAPSDVAICLNSSRFALVTDCNAGGIALEEGVTDSMILDNSLITTTNCSLRVNDMECQRDSFVGNTMNAGVLNTGAIAIAEGTDITLAYNRVAPSAAGGSLIWLGLTKGGQVYGNAASLFTFSHPQTPLDVYSNSWQ